jgi:hypothetical protein
VGGFADDEIPLLVMLFYLFRQVEASRPHGCLVLGLRGGLARPDLRGRQRQVGSLAGAAHLLNDNTGVLR